jgi:hypothetical protein
MDFPGSPAPQKGPGLLARVGGWFSASRMSLVGYAFFALVCLFGWEKMRADAAHAELKNAELQIETLTERAQVLEGEKAGLERMLEEANTKVDLSEQAALADAERRGAQRVRLDQKKGALQDATKAFKCGCPGASGRVLRELGQVATQSAGAAGCVCPGSPGPDAPGLPRGAPEGKANAGAGG